MFKYYYDAPLNVPTIYAEYKKVTVVYNLNITETHCIETSLLGYFSDDKQIINR